jgi:hypothetical protein
MKKLFIPFTIGVVFVSTILYAQTKTAQGLIIHTTSQEETDKIVKSLEKVDPSTYRFTVTTVTNGKKSTKVFGTAPLSSIQKIGGGVRTPGAVSESSDIIILVKVITKGKELQNQLISQLDRNLSKVSTKQLTLSANNAIIKGH